MAEALVHVRNAEAPGAVTLTGLFLTAASWTVSFALWLIGAAYFSYRIIRFGFRFALYPAGRMVARMLA